MPRKKNPLPKNSPHRIIADAMKNAFVNSGLAKRSEVLVFRDHDGDYFGITVNSPQLHGYVRVHPEWDSEELVLDFLSGYKFEFTYADGSTEKESSLWPSFLTSDSATDQEMADAAKARVERITNLLLHPPVRNNPIKSLGSIALAGLAGYLIGKN